MNIDSITNVEFGVDDVTISDISYNKIEEGTTIIQYKGNGKSFGKVVFNLKSDLSTNYQYMSDNSMLIILHGRYSGNGYNQQYDSNYNEQSGVYVNGALLSNLNDTLLNGGLSYVRSFSYTLNNDASLNDTNFDPSTDINIDYALFVYPQTKTNGGGDYVYVYPSITILKYDTTNITPTELNNNFVKYLLLKTNPDYTGKISIKHIQLWVRNPETNQLYNACEDRVISHNDTNYDIYPNANLVDTSLKPIFNDGTQQFHKLMIGMTQDKLLRNNFSNNYCNGVNTNLSNHDTTYFHNISNITQQTHLLIDLVTPIHIDDIDHAHIYAQNLTLSGETIQEINAVQLLNINKTPVMGYDMHPDAFYDASGELCGHYIFMGRGFNPRNKMKSRSILTTNSDGEYGKIIKKNNYVNPTPFTNTRYFRLYDMANISTFRYIVLKTKSFGSLNLREVQCWVDNINVCTLPNVEGKFVADGDISNIEDISYGDLSGEDSYGITTFGDVSLAFDNLFNTHLHPRIVGSDSVIIDLNAEYSINDLQCLINYNRTGNNISRYDTLETIYLLSPTSKIVSYYRHVDIPDDRIDSNGNYKEVYRYEGPSFNKVSPSFLASSSANSVETTKIMNNSSIMLSYVFNNVLIPKTNSKTNYSANVTISGGLQIT